MNGTHDHWIGVLNASYFTMQDARNVMDEAKADRRLSAQMAHENGVSLAEIGEVFGVSKQAVWGWLMPTEGNGDD